jgi:hypothetical protein
MAPSRIAARSAGARRQTRAPSARGHRLPLYRWARLRGPSELRKLLRRLNLAASWNGSGRLLAKPLLPEQLLAEARRCIVGEG